MVAALSSNFSVSILDFFFLFFFMSFLIHSYLGKNSPVFCHRYLNHMGWLETLERPFAYEIPKPVVR